MSRSRVGKKENRKGSHELILSKDNLIYQRNGDQRHNRMLAKDDRNDETTRDEMMFRLLLPAVD